MTQINVGQSIPNFTASATNEQTFNLADYRGKNVIIYFYPKDNTPGCTLEGQNFRDQISFFNEHNTVIFGVSKDTLRKHENFKAKHAFPFELLSDEDGSLCELFDVIKNKMMYGKSFLGIERSTFLIDAEGVLRYEWRKVKVKQHIDEVKQAILAL